MASFEIAVEALSEWTCIECGGEYEIHNRHHLHELGSCYYRPCFTPPRVVHRDAARRLPLRGRTVLDPSDEIGKDRQAVRPSPEPGFRIDVACVSQIDEVRLPVLRQPLRAR